MVPRVELDHPIATRVPRSLLRAVKEHCIRHDVRMQAFVREALAERLRTVARRGQAPAAQASG